MRCSGGATDEGVSQSIIAAWYDSGPAARDSRCATRDPAASASCTRRVRVPSPLDPKVRHRPAQGTGRGGRARSSPHRPAWSRPQHDSPVCSRAKVAGHPAVVSRRRTSPNASGTPAAHVSSWSQVCDTRRRRSRAWTRITAYRPPGQRTPSIDRARSAIVSGPHAAHVTLRSIRPARHRPSRTTPEQTPALFRSSRAGSPRHSVADMIRPHQRPSAGHHTRRHPIAGPHRQRKPLQAASAHLAAEGIGPCASTAGPSTPRENGGASRPSGLRHSARSRVRT
ncbi:MAG: hypothetical protein RIQ53_3847 [Pseudomonadota bacterium]|jgi:hypothetical protein